MKQFINIDKSLAEVNLYANYLLDIETNGPLSV